MLKLPICDFKIFRLPFTSEFKTLPQKQFQSVAVVNYTDQELYTRITEFKHFLTAENILFVESTSLPS